MCLVVRVKHPKYFSKFEKLHHYHRVWRRKFLRTLRQWRCRDQRGRWRPWFCRARSSAVGGSSHSTDPQTGSPPKLIGRSWNGPRWTCQHARGNIWRKFKFSGIICKPWLCVCKKNTRFRTHVLDDDPWLKKITNGLVTRREKNETYSGGVPSSSKSSNSILTLSPSRASKV